MAMTRQRNTKRHTLATAVMRSLLLFLMTRLAESSLQSRQGIADSFFDMDEPSKNDLVVYMEALDRALMYVNVTKKNNMNILLGVFFTEVHLTQAMIPAEFNKLDSDIKLAVKSMLRFCENTRLVRHHYKKDVNDRKLLQFISDPRLWMNTTRKFNRGHLTRWLPRSNATLTWPAAGSFQGIAFPWHVYVKVSTSRLITPWGAQSDNCLIALSNVVVQRTMQSCGASAFCKKVMFEGLSVGYPLAHRYLYLLFSSTVKRCYHTSPLADQIRMDVLCALLYLEAVYIEKFHFKKRDLFMEIVSICSLRGYQEFIKKRWISAILDWQTKNGCFIPGEGVKICEDHTTAVGLINLAIAVRYVVQIKAKSV